jgi:hypothetical protein
MLAAIGFLLILIALRRLQRAPMSETHLHLHIHMLPPPRRNEPPEPPPDILGELDRVVRDHRRIARKV